MAIKAQISVAEAKRIGEQLGIKWEYYTVEHFAQGMNVELEHGLQDPETNVSDDDLIITGKLAWAHLKKYPDYYVRLEKMEAEAKAYWERKKSKQ